MSEVINAFRSMAGEAANGVSDQDLILYVGNHYPQLLGDQEFNNEYNGAKWKSLGGWEGRKQDEKEIGLWAKTKQLAETAGTSALGGVAGLVKQAGGVAQSPLGWMAGPLAATAKMAPGLPEKIADVGAEEQKRYAGLAAMRAGEGKIMQMVPELTAGTVQMMPALAASYFGNTKLGSMVGGMQSFGNMYKDAYDYYVANGSSPQAAKWKAMGPATVSGLITAGIFEAGGKVGGPTKLMERFAKGEFSAQSLAQLIGGVLAGGGIGATLGGANTLAEDFLRKKTIEPDKDWKDIWHDVVMSAATTGIIGSAIGAGGGIRAYVKSKGAAAGTGEAPTTPPAQLDAQERLIQRIESTRPEELPRLYEEIKRNTPEGQMQRLQAVLDEIKRRATQAEAAEKATKPQPETEATPQEAAEAVTEYETRKRTESEAKLAEIQTKIDGLTSKMEKGFAKGMEPHPADAAELSRLMELKRLVTSDEPVLSWEPLVEGEPISRSNLRIVAGDLRGRLETLMRQGKLDHRGETKLAVLDELVNNPNPTEEQYRNAANALELRLDEKAARMPRQYDFLEPKPGTEAKTTPAEQPVVEGIPEGGTVKPNVPSAETTGKAAPTAGPVEPAKPTGEVIPSGEVQEKGPEVVRPAATTAEVLGTKPAVATEKTAAEPAPAAAPVEVPAGPQRYRIGKSPQTYVVEERLPQTEVEKANGEQPVRVRNEKTAEVSVVMESDLKPVETRVKTEGKKTAGASLDDQLREAGMDPSVFKSSKEKRRALIRSKAKEIFPGEAPIGAAIIGMNPRLLRFAYEKLNMARYNILNWIENMPLRRIVTSVFAGGEVAAHNYANQQGKHIELKIPNRLDRQGMAFVHESGGSLPLLRQWQAMIAGKSVLADKAIDHAINNFARLNAFRPWLKQLLDLQLQREINAGIDTNKLEDYISHYWDMDAMGPQGGFVLRRKGGGGLSTAFRQQRQFPNIATGINKGAIPRSLDVAELVNARVRMGERLINRRLWIESMQKVNNVLDGEPVVVPWDKNTPNNYEMLDLGPGLQFGVNRDFAELFGALMAESQVRRSTVGNVLLMGAQGIKHGLLAFDLFHAARMMYKGASLGVKPTFREQNMKGLALLEYLPGDVDAAVNKGLITPEVRSHYDLWKDFTDVSVSKGLEVGRVSDAMYKDLTDSMHEVVAKMFGAHPDVIARYNVLSRYNKWLFEKFQRSIMVEANNYEAMRRLNNEPHIWDDLNKSTRDRLGRDATFEEKVKYVARVAKRNPNGQFSEIMRQTARDINVYFGNLGKQGLFKTATWQDLMRIGFLAPQWVEGMVTAELKGIGQAAKVPWDLATKRQFGIGTIAKGMGTGILAHMVLNQLINLVFRGQFTWQNEENKKGFLGNPPEWVNDNMSAWMPDLSGKSEGFKISPFSVFAEVAHDLIRFDVLERPQEALERIASNKASPLARAEKTFRTKMDWEGNRLTDTWDRAKATMWALAPTPIPISPLFQSKDMIGQKVQRQLTGSLGIKMEPVQGGEKGRARNEIASRLFNGKRFEDLDLPERARVLKQAERLYPNIEHPHRFRERIRTAEREEDILNTIKKNMDRGLVNALRDKGVNIKGMKPEVTMGGQSVYFTEDEEKEMVKTVAKNYDELLKRVQPRLAKMNLVQAQELADRAMSLAREKTVIQMRKSIRARTKQ